MINSKLLKVKKWVDLNEAAQRLSIALNEPVNALDLMELALDGELVLSVKLPFDKKYVAKKMWEKFTPVGERLKELFEFSNFIFKKDYDKTAEEYIRKENEYIAEKYSEFLRSDVGRKLTEDQKTLELYCNEMKWAEWEYGDVEYLDESVYELSMLGSEHIDVMWLIRQNKNMEMDELTNLDGVILRSREGDLYNLQEQFDEEYIQKKEENDEGLNPLKKIAKRQRLNPQHYFPAGGLPIGCELGMSPENMSKFEAKLSEGETHVSEQQVSAILGAVLQEITSSEAKKWTQGDLAARIGDKKIPGLSERTVNGVFSDTKKVYKSMK